MAIVTSGKGTSKRVQALLLAHYIEPARQRGKKKVRVTAGEIIRELKLQNRAPQVCTAMQGQRFLKQHGLEIMKREGPPSGQSTTVAVTYIWNDNGQHKKDPLLALYGRLRDAFAAEGGAERALQKERTAFHRDFERRQRTMWKQS
ncbi:MAG: hypothetical protein EPN33_06265 [Acidobacteria bacterium]|nr:MAG: hypothetical protein EPN33_06265 [Acidobacteriota bacterium]